MAKVTRVARLAASRGSRRVLDLNGPYWTSMDLSLTSFDPIGPQWTCLGPDWTLLYRNGPVSDLVGPQWTCLGPPWTLLDRDGPALDLIPANLTQKRP